MKQYCISYLCCASKTFENEKKYSSLLLPENTIFSHLQKFAPVRWVPSRRIILCQLPVLCSGRGASKLNISDCRLKLFPLFLSLYTVEFLALRGESRIKMSPNISPILFRTMGQQMWTNPLFPFPFHAPSSILSFPCSFIMIRPRYFGVRSGGCFACKLIASTSYIGQIGPIHTYTHNHQTCQ